MGIVWIIEKLKGCVNSSNEVVVFRDGECGVLEKWTKMIENDLMWIFVMALSDGGVGGHNGEAGEWS